MAIIGWKGGTGAASDAKNYVGGVAAGTLDLVEFGAGASTITGGSVDSSGTFINYPDLGAFVVNGGTMTADGSFAIESLSTLDLIGPYYGVEVGGGGLAVFDANSAVNLHHGTDEQGNASDPLAVPDTGQVAIGLGSTKDSSVTGPGSALFEGYLRADHIEIGDGAVGQATISGASAQIYADEVYGAGIDVGIGAQGVLTVKNAATVTTTGFLNVGVITSGNGGSAVLIDGTGTTFNANGAGGGTFGSGSVEIGASKSVVQVTNNATLNVNSWTQVELGSSFIIDDTAHVTGGVVLVGGAFDAVAHAGATGLTETTFAGDIGVEYYTSGTNSVGAGPNAVLNLTGQIYGVLGNPGDLTFNGGYVILSHADNIYSNSTINSGTVEYGYTDLAGGLLELAAPGAAGTGTIRFDAGTRSGLIIDAGALPSNTITGFATGDSLIFRGISFDHVGYSGSTLSLLTATGQDVGDLAIGTGYTPGFFSVTSTAGVETVSAPPCFLRGTRIQTARGEVAVEDLVAGNLIATRRASDTVFSPIRWLGSTRFDARRHPRPSEVWPVRIRAGALADGVPHRDLLVSPGHALLIDGVLLQAERLVNGATIVVDRDIERGEYFHVELAEHDILISEGALSESYLDTGNRGAFSNSRGLTQLYPDFSPRHWTETCVPLVTAGPHLVAARERLIARAPLLGWTRSHLLDFRVFADGQLIEPSGQSGTNWRFDVPAWASSIWLISAAGVPAEQLPASHDRRRLGLKVDHVTRIVDGAPVDWVPDEVVFGTGWYAREADGGATWRWSDGNAELLIAGPCTVEISVIGFLSAWLGSVDGEVLCDSGGALPAMRA